MQLDETTRIGGKAPIRVMVVEDHLVYRIGLKVIIKADSELQIVAEAGDGQKAIALAQQLHPNVIVMDVSMPVLDGIESTKQIKTLAPKSKILMLTSHDGDDEVFSSLSAGADGYCLKDKSSELICAAIKAVSNGVCWLDPVIAKKVLMVCLAPSVVAGKKTVSAAEAKFGISPRQMEILQLVVEGMSNLQMAERLSVSPETIKTHMHNIMDRLAVSDRTQVAVKAIRSGLVKLDNS